MNPRSLLVLCCLVSSLLPVLRAQTSAPAPVEPKPPVIKLGVGFDYAIGKYGFTDDTVVTSVPVNGSYEQGRWAFKTTIPYLTIKGPASVVVGSGGAEGAPPRPTSNTESGLGDITASATFHARPVPGKLNVDFTGRVKFPTASVSKGLGTGETDYYTQLDLYQSMGKVTPFATLGYRFLGKNAAFALKDGAYVTAGAAYRFTDKIVAGAGYDWRSRIIDGAENGTDGLAFISYNANPHFNLLAYMLVGFNDASPDLGVGGLATYKF